MEWRVSQDALLPPIGKGFSHALVHPTPPHHGTPCHATAQFVHICQLIKMFNQSCAKKQESERIKPLRLPHLRKKCSVCMWSRHSIFIALALVSWHLTSTRQYDFASQPKHKTSLTVVSLNSLSMRILQCKLDKYTMANVLFSCNLRIAAKHKTTDRAESNEGTGNGQEKVSG